MMVRTQITLDRDMHRRVKEKAARMGISLAEYVRRVIKKELAEPRRRGEISEMFDLGSSGRSDVSSDKYAYVGEAVEARRLGGRSTDRAA